MDVRRLVRGTIPWTDLERVAEEIRDRYDRPSVRVEFLEADNWLSTPMVVEEEWFVKVISPHNTRIHALFTGARNLGAFTSGSTGFFEPFDTPGDMARHELEATRTMRTLGVNAPAPIEAFELDQLGVVVLEYLPSYASLSTVTADRVEELAPDLFAALARMHGNGLVHGDLRGENVLISDGDIFFIDATNVRDDGIDDGSAYDLACALATLSPSIGSRAAITAALTEYDLDALLAAREFIDLVRLRPDHDFDAARVKGEIETRASRR